MISTVLPVTLVHTSFFNKLKDKLDGRKIDTEYHKDKIQLGIDFKTTHIRSELRLWITKDKYIDIDVYVTDDIGTDILLGKNFLLASSVKHIKDNKIIIEHTPDIMIPLHKTFKKLRQSRKKQQNKIETERIIKYSSLKVLTTALQKVGNSEFSRQLQPLNKGLYTEKQPILIDEYTQTEITQHDNTDFHKNTEISTQEKQHQKISTQEKQHQKISTQEKPQKHTEIITQEKQKQEEKAIKLITKNNTQYNRDMLKPAKTPTKITQKEDIKIHQQKQKMTQKLHEECLFCEELRPCKWIEPHDIIIHTDSTQIPDYDRNRLHIVIPKNYNRELIKTCKLHKYLTKNEETFTQTQNTHKTTDKQEKLQTYAQIHNTNETQNVQTM